MADEPKLPELQPAERRKLELDQRWLRETLGFDRDYKHWPLSDSQPAKLTEAPEDGGVGRTIQLAEGLLDYSGSVYMLVWARQPEAPCEQFEEWVSLLSESIATDTARLWSSVSERHKDWYEQVCRGKVEDALERRAKRLAAEALNHEFLRLEASKDPRAFLAAFSPESLPSASSEPASVFAQATATTAAGLEVPITPDRAVGVGQAKQVPVARAGSRRRGRRPDPERSRAIALILNAIPGWEELDPMVVARTLDAAAQKIDAPKTKEVGSRGKREPFTSWVEYEEHVDARAFRATMNDHLNRAN